MRRLRLAAGIAAAVPLALLATAAPATAAVPTYGPIPNSCTTTTHNDTTTGMLDVTLDGPGYTHADASLVANGLRVTTPDSTDKLTFQVIVSTEASFVLVPQVTHMSFKTWNNNAASDIIATYKLFITNPALPNTATVKNWTTLVFRPTGAGLHTDGNVWTIDDSSKFWSTQTVPGMQGQGVEEKTWSEIKTLFATWIVGTYEVGQGKGDTGSDTTVNNVKFSYNTVGATVTTCAAEHIWAKKVEPTHTPPGDGGGGQGLPPTGLEVTTYVIAGAALVGFGAVMLLVARRRRTTRA
jgi:hypothetical protein